MVQDIEILFTPYVGEMFLVC